MDMDWEQIKPDFDWDGSWRDIYVLGTTMADWQTMLDAIRDRYPQLSFSVFGESCELPERAEELGPWETGAFLSFAVEGVQLNCHFFRSDRIEFDLDPRQVRGAREANGLAEFMSCLGRRLGMEVVLTLENSQDAVILRYLPYRDEVVWMPPTPGGSDH
jgi:hypothetical protein